MSLGSRIASRGKAALTATPASTPKEPLLFLYPQWVRNSSTATTAEGIYGNNGQSIGSTYDHPIFVDSHLSKAETDDVPSSNSRLNLAQDETSNTLSKVDPDEGTILTTDHSRPSDAKGRIRGLKTSRAPTVLRVSTPAEQRVRKILSQVQQVEDSNTNKSRTRKAYQLFRKEQLRSWVPDWRVILADLNKHTIQHGKWLDKAIIVEVPEKSAAKLMSGVDDSIWDIGARYDCSVTLGDRKDIKEGHLSFVISGPATAISKSTADALRIAPDAVVKASVKEVAAGSEAEMKNESEIIPATSTSIAMAHIPGRDGTVRNVLSKTRSMNQALPADKIPRPAVWSIASFADYVRALTYTDVPNHLQLFMYKTSEDHTTAITNILRSLFTDTQCRDSISRTAFNEAMAYLVKTNRIEDARLLFVYMEMINLQLDPETFNIMMRGAAKPEDLHNFHFILHLMLRRGFSPNAKTWIAFMMGVSDLRIRLYIMAAMRDRGLLQHPSTMKAICELLVVQETESSIDQMQSQEEFLAHMDSRYGPYWMTVDSANRIIHVLGARGLISRCWEFLSAMDSRFIQSDNYSVNTILHHCKQQSNLVGAIEILRDIPVSSTFSPDQETYRILFEMAWRSRSYNVARVIWRYACLSGATTRRMRTLVRSSLRDSNLGVDVESPRARFNHNAGLVIIGDNVNGEHPVLAVLGNVLAKKGFEDEKPLARQRIIPNYSVLEANREEPSTREPTPREESTTREEPNPESKAYVPVKDKSQSIRAKIVDNGGFLAHDYAVFQEWLPLNSFSDMLVRALERDEEWKVAESEAREKKELGWMLENAIYVKVRHRHYEKGNCLEWK